MKKYVTWEEIEDYAQKLKAHCAKVGFAPDGIYGPARGAIPFREIVADVMGIKKRLITPKKEALHIDDIADSGVTLQVIMRRKSHPKEYADPVKKLMQTKVGDYFITTMYYHPRSVVKPDFYTELKSKSSKDAGDWIVFPYEEVKKRETDVLKLRAQIAESTGTVNVTWRQIEGFLFDTMVECYEKGHKPTGVYGIRGGGELLATWLSNGYNLDMLDAPTERCIVINDFAKYNECELYKNCYIVSMFGKKKGDGGMFKVTNYDRIIMPYKVKNRAKGENECQRPKKQKLR